LSGTFFHRRHSLPPEKCVGRADRCPELARRDYYIAVLDYGNGVDLGNDIGGCQLLDGGS
jgi:hypothetical protein